MQLDYRKLRTYTIHASLFILTFITVTLAGVTWLNKNVLELSNFYYGLPYSLCLLAMLSAHEFGHYLTARSYGISATLPYYIPLPVLPPFLMYHFGTMGAVIRIRSAWTSKRALFDVGIAGPLAGFIVTVGILLYGFFTLPGIDYLYSIHPEYRLEGMAAGGLTFGNSALFWGLSRVFSLGGFVPPMNEIYHYPFLCVGWFGLFVTALNLMPVGQLDGGHILYALAGRKIQGRVARVFFGLLAAVGLVSLIPLVLFNIYMGTLGWLLWGVILFFIVKLDHPEIPDDTPLSHGRKVLGWITFLIFVLSFPPIPIME